MSLLGECKVTGVASSTFWACVEGINPATPHHHPVHDHDHDYHDNVMMMEMTMMMMMVMMAMVLLRSMFHLSLLLFRHCRTDLMHEL